MIVTAMVPSDLGYLYDLETQLNLVLVHAESGEFDFYGPQSLGYVVDDRSRPRGAASQSRVGFCVSLSGEEEACVEARSKPLPCFFG